MHRAASLGSLIAVLSLLVYPSYVLPQEPPPRSKARLAVLLVFDQMAAQYLEEWQELFDPDGFTRLLREGTVFRNCHYPYSDTVTAAGHASIVTGCSPRIHGIVGNDWHDRRVGKDIYCVETDRYALVPPPKEKTSGKRGNVPAAPHALLAPTVGDALKAATGGKGRVVSLSLKDRSAVIPGGQHPDVCYWMAPTTGDFITSTWYRGTPHPWIASFNSGRPVDRWFKRDWVRLLPDLDYARFSGPDNGPGEGKGIKQGTTFPHPTTGGLEQPGKEYFDAVYTSPFGNDLLMELATQAIQVEQLGKDETPDLLCLSFSSNDAVGHAWGPRSQEVLDITLRSDRIVRDLLRLLDQQVGKGNYVVVVSADHGICPLPETILALGGEAGRINDKTFKADIEDFLARRFGVPGGKERWVEALLSPGIYLNRRLLKQHGLSTTTVEDALSEFLRRQHFIQTVYTRTQLLEGIPADDRLGQAVLRSFHPERCGDLFPISRPYYFVSSYLTGTSHGTPHPYDTHVPLVVYGTGIRPQISQEPVTPQAAAVVLAHALGIPAPQKAEVSLPRSLIAGP